MVVEKGEEERGKQEGKEKRNTIKELEEREGGDGKSERSGR